METLLVGFFCRRRDFAERRAEIRAETVGVVTCWSLMGLASLRVKDVIQWHALIGETAGRLSVYGWIGLGAAVAVIQRYAVAPYSALKGLNPTGLTQMKAPHLASEP